MKRRPGYSLMELLVVMAILVTIGAVAAPTWRMLSGDTKVKAGADIVKGRLADARATAMEQGRPFSVSVSPDGLQIRVLPTDPNASAASQVPTGGDGMMPDEVQIVVATDEAEEFGPMMEADGWVHLVTYKPDGTCLEDSATLRVLQAGQVPMVIRVRGMTGGCEIYQETLQTSGAAP